MCTTLEDLDRIKSRIIEVLRAEKKELTSEELRRKLNVSLSQLSIALFELSKEGIVERKYTEEYDPTRPFDTVSWILVREAEEAPSPEILLRKGIRLVFSIPLSMHTVRARLLNRYRALDFLDAYTSVIELAKQEIKIVCPVIDAYGMFPVISKVAKNPQLRVRIITELDKSKDLLYLIEVVSKNRFQVADATKTIRYEDRVRKICGVHTKIVIADDEVALVGSFNFSKYHYFVNFDLGFLILNQEIVGILSKLFDELWNYVTSSKYRS
ncbi:MAG: hypothetical protein DRJ59_06985 [Thermoprotei archaeon]|nr:MAG: hypothetical protein DRJ59_06985 [Thermoprotei archaeon]